MFLNIFIELALFFALYFCVIGALKKYFSLHLRYAVILAYFSLIGALSIVFNFLSLFELINREAILAFIAIVLVLSVKLKLTCSQTIKNSL